MEKVRGQKMQVREKVGKSVNTVFPMFCGPGESKSRLAKAAGAEPAGQMRGESCTPLWRETHLEVKSVKTSPFELSLWVWSSNFRILNAGDTATQKQVHSLESNFVDIFLSKIGAL